MAKSEREELTAEERQCGLPKDCEAYRRFAKALRIIDAHAADRAALVAQLEAASPVATVKVGDETYLLRNGKRYRGRVKYIRAGLAICDFQWGNGALWQEGIQLESLGVVK